MNKIIVILLFIILAFNIFPEGKEFPGKIGFDEKFKFIIKDSSNPSKGDSTSDDFLLDYAGINNEMIGSIAFKIGKFYTITPWLQDNFNVYYTNSIIIENEFILGLKNTFAILNIINIGFNPEYRIFSKTGGHLNLEIKPIIQLNGKYDNGFTWSIEQKFPIVFNPELNKDNDPDADGGVFDSFRSETKIVLDFEFFHFFAPEYLRCHLYGENEIIFSVPYSWGYEKQKTLTQEVKIGFLFEFWRIRPGVYIWFKTYDYYFESAPIDGHLGSANTFNTATPVHSQPGMQLGTKIGIDFAHKWFSMGIDYKGYSEVRASDVENNIDTHEYDYWKNEVETWFRISF